MHADAGTVRPGPPCPFSFIVRGSRFSSGVVHGVEDCVRQVAPRVQIEFMRFASKDKSNLANFLMEGLSSVAIVGIAHDGDRS
jgi:hypothetical protein